MAAPGKARDCRAAGAGVPALAAGSTGDLCCCSKC